MGFAFGSVGFHKGSLLTFKGCHFKNLTCICKTVFPLALASGKNKVKCILGLWLLHTQASLEGGYNFSSYVFNKHLLASVGPDLLRPVVISSSKSILELKLPGDVTSLSSYSA